MKIYIVTEGSYSDYHIEKVFTDKTKAEKYASLNPCYEYHTGRTVEEYDTSDDDVMIDKAEVKTVVHVNYSVCEDVDKKTVKEKMTVDYETYDTYEYPDINNYPYYRNKANYSVAWHGGEHTFEIVLSRIVNKKDKAADKEKYRKICRDYFAKAKALQALEGMAWKQVADVLFEKYGEVTDENSKQV